MNSIKVKQVKTYGDHFPSAAYVSGLSSESTPDPPIFPAPPQELVSFGSGAHAHAGDGPHAVSIPPVELAFWTPEPQLPPVCPGRNPQLKWSKCRKSIISNDKHEIILDKTISSEI